MTREMLPEYEAWQIEAVDMALASLRRGDAKFADGDEVERWLVSWGSAEEIGAPTCK